MAGQFAIETTDVSGGVRQPGGNAQVWALTEAADRGTSAVSGFALEDPSAAATIPSLAPVAVEEAGCTTHTRLYSGFTADRSIGRADALRVADQREWDVGTTDLNVLLGDIVIQSGKRPAETDIARIDWMIAAGYCPVGEGDLFDRTNPVDLPVGDYTGRTAFDLLSDASGISGKNFYVYSSQLSGTALGEWLAAGHGPAPDVDASGSYVCAYSYWNKFGFNDYVAIGTVAYILVDLTWNGYQLDIRFRENSDAGPHNPFADAVGGTRYPEAVATGVGGNGSGSASLFFGPWVLDSVDVDPAPGWQVFGGPGSYDTPRGAPGTMYQEGGIRAYAFVGGDVDLTATWSMRVRAWYVGGPGAEVPITWPSIPGLAYHPPVWSENTSTLRISNYLSDLDPDPVTGLCQLTFPPSPTDKLPRSGARRYSGVWFEYNGSPGHVYIDRFSSGLYARRREVRASDMAITTAAAATAAANLYLDRCVADEDSFTANIGPVPAASVNLALPGQRIPVRLSHVPGWTDWTYLAIRRRTVSPLGGDLYHLTFELSDPVYTGFHGAPGVANPGSTLNPPVYQNVGTIAHPIPADDAANAVRGQWVGPVTLTCDGLTSDWTLPTGYLEGSVRLTIDATSQSVTEDDPDAGDISVDWTPGASDTATALYQAA